MNVSRGHSLYNPLAHTILLKEVSYQQDMAALMVDMASSEIPTRSLYGAAQHTRDLFELVTFCSQMFEARDVPNDLYLIHKQYLVPGDVLARAQLCTGYVLLGLFSRQAFEEHFPLVCRTAIAVNNGHLHMEEALATDLDFEDLSSRISDMNARMGTYKSSGTKRRRHENVIGSFRSTHDLDGAIERYHFYLLPEDGEEEAWRTSMASEMRGSDLNEAWSYRATLLSAEYVLGQSCRMTATYKNLMQLADLVRPGEFIHYRPNLRNLSKVSAKLTERDVVVDLFRQYLKSYQWQSVFDPDTWSLDLRNQVAWKVEDSHKLDLRFFYEHSFYTMFSGVSQMGRAADRLEGLTSHVNIDQYTRRVWQETINQLFDPEGNAMATPDAVLKNRFTCLYPAMANMKALFGSLAHVLKAKGQVSRCFLNPHFGRFFLSVYDDVMKGGLFEMSEARKVQYKCFPQLSANFRNGCLNGARWEETGRLLPLATRMLVGVEPTQDVLANQLLLFASLCGICHLSTEFFLCLFANVHSFTTRKEKPMIVLDGPTGAGKSYMMHCIQAIVVGSGETQNNYACVDEHYATTRSHTVSLQNPYCSVLGQRLIEEWQSGSRGNNPYLDNVSLESVTMKNSYDHGMSCSQRCKTVKNKNKEERIVRSVEFALTDRSTVILANGFEVCSSIEERCMVYRIPDLTARVSVTPQDQLLSVLEHHKVPQFFSLLRYHISEQYNRDALGLCLKRADHEPELDGREIDLTFSRMEEVLETMGLSSRQILTHRKKIQIVKFAELLAHWRAVVEVFGSVHWDCAIRPPEPGQSFDEYNEYLSGTMADHLGRLGSDEKDKRVAARVVVDPSDILSATTLVIQFDKSDRRLLRILCCHLADPSNFETVEPWGENYLYLENVTLRRICDELKKRSLPILKESLGHSLAVLEDTMLKNNVPYVIRRFDGSGINRHREKDMQQFSLLVNAAHASTVYAQESDVQLRQLIDALAGYLVRCARGEVECNWVNCNHLRGLKIGYVRLTVPVDLARGCSFLYHLPLEPRPFRSHEVRPCTDEPTLAQVEVNVDFGWSRLKALQSMLVEHLCRETNEEEKEEKEDLLADKLGYLVLPVKNRQMFSFGPSYANKSLVADNRGGKLVQVEQDGSISVHVAVFMEGYGSSVIRKLRNAVVQMCLKRNMLAERNYFGLSWNDSQELGMSQKILQAKVPSLTCRTDSLFKRAGNVLLCHLSLLNSIPLSSGVMEEEVNMGKLLVERTLCKNMTDQSTVMVFDRDKVYRTQDLADSLCFIDVKEAGLRREEGKLPEYWRVDRCSKRVEDISSAKDLLEINTCSKDGRVTFHPFHRLRKLAMKHLLKEDSLARANVEDNWEEVLDEAVNHVRHQYVQIQGRAKLCRLPDLLQPTGKGTHNGHIEASEVYHRQHILFRNRLHAD